MVNGDALALRVWALLSYSKWLLLSRACPNDNKRKLQKFAMGPTVYKDPFLGLTQALCNRQELTLKERGLCKWREIFSK